MLLQDDNMEHIPEVQRIINGCVKMEYSVAAMYNIFLHSFPEERKFWEDLFFDEMEHAYRLKTDLYVKSNDLLPTMNPLLTIELIENSIEKAENKRRQIMNVPVSLKDALKVALRLEESLLEIYSNKLLKNVLASDHESLSNKIISFEILHINKISDQMTIKDSSNLS